MPKNKFCCRVFPIVSILVSALIAAIIWYSEKGVNLFELLKDRGDFFEYLGAVLFIAFLPIGLFYYLNDKEEYQAKARIHAFLGFLPALGYLVYSLV